ncbi:MAG: hypothetical protein NVSMB2_18680 [Chloroflexota bacterium]
MRVNLDIPLDAATMHLRRSELDAVVEDVGQGDVSFENQAARLVEAVRTLPPTDRAPTWELVARHVARRTPLPLAAGQIGMDLLHARDLLAALQQAIAALPASER